MIGWARQLAAKTLVPGLAAQLREQSETVRLPSERLRRLQLAKLNRLLGTWRRVEFYARHLSEHGGPTGPLDSLEQLGLLPVVTRDFLRANLERIAALPTARRRGSTSGSTGSNLWFYQSAGMLRARSAAALLAWRWVGADGLGDRRVIIRGHVPARTRFDEFWLGARTRLQGALLMPTAGLSRQRVAEYLVQIARFRPRLLDAMPNTLYLLACWGREQGIAPLRLAGLICSGEQLFDEQRRRIEDYFAAPVYQRYGCNEFGLVAHHCARRGPLHVPPTRLLVETDAEGQLLLTDLDNTATPFIRYAIGDAGRVAPSDCPCGLGGQMLTELSGRVQDRLITPGGLFTPGQFWAMTTRLVPGIEEVQVVQVSADAVELRVRVGEHYRAAYAEVIRRRVQARVGDGFRVSVVKVDAIPRTAAGKRHYVIGLTEPARPAGQPREGGPS